MQVLSVSSHLSLSLSHTEIGVEYEEYNNVNNNTTQQNQLFISFKNW